ncbi:MAG: hypothetical protein COB76_03670 [Alphaproteobacteria bacterium]|nr:MAG: hypothetical protein COB76_03670 [Alphaproteobacteria bacterium]
MLQNNKHYVIAEIANAHGKLLGVCMGTLEGAHAAGANAFKVATYKPKDLTVKSDLPAFSLEGTPWAKFKDFYGLYENIHMPWDFHAPLFERGAELGIDVFSSPFSPTAVDYLKTNFEPPFYKIASFEIVDDELLASASSTGKPVIISTGQANYDDIDHALTVAQSAGATDIYLLHCISSYPADISIVNMKSFVALKKRFGTRAKIGLSDHTITITAPLLGLAMGGEMLEKHITLTKDEFFENGARNPDVAFSLTPDEYKIMMDSIRVYEEYLGDKRFDDFEQACQSVVSFIGSNPQFSKMAGDDLGRIEDAWGEDQFLRKDEDFLSGYRRSLIVTQDVSAGEKLVYDENFSALRPGHGAHPRHRPVFEDAILTRDIKVGEGLAETCIQAEQKPSFNKVETI